MKPQIKENDRVIIPAWVDGFGEDKTGSVTEIETFMDTILITVKYDIPDFLGRMIKVVHENQLIKITKTKTTKRIQNKLIFKQ